jgi:hypothetical protein
LTLLLPKIREMRGMPVRIAEAFKIDKSALPLEAYSG